METKKLRDGAAYKLTEEEVATIREATGKDREIAKLFGISRQHVNNLRRGQGWGGGAALPPSRRGPHEKRFGPRKKRNLEPTKAQIAEIRSIPRKITDKMIARAYGLWPDQIYLIRHP